MKLTAAVKEHRFINITIVLVIAGIIAAGAFSWTGKAKRPQVSAIAATSKIPGVDVLGVENTSLGSSQILVVRLQNNSGKAIKALTIRTGKTWVTKNYLLIEESFATGKVSDGAYADQYSAFGGLVGSDFGIILNDYAIGRVTSSGGGDNGGLVGYSGYSATLSHSYSTGRISAGHDSYVGGLLGVDLEDTTEIIKSYWDLDTSGVPNPDQGAGNIPHDKGIRGLTTQEFQSGLPDKFDPTIWGHNLNINNGYPYLLANPPPK